MKKGKREEKIILKILDKIPTEIGTCGIRTKLITEEDSDILAISHLKILDAKKHYHKKTTEVYYVLDGRGELEVDGDLLSLEKGTLVMIKPGVIHRAISHDNLKVLIIMAPPIGETQDQIIIGEKDE